MKKLNSQYLGVSKVIRRGKEYFYARIRHNGTQVYICSGPELECAHRYDERAKELYGEGAIVNFKETLSKLDGNNLKKAKKRLDNIS